MAYLTKDEESKAREKGFTHNRCTKVGSSLQKKQRHIWSIQEGWQTADLINGYFTNHKKYKNILWAIKRKL